jgi:carboxymethylenebutenolidase
MGGGFALLTAARGFHASAPNYGTLPKDPQGVLAGACPIVASYGGRDRGLKGAAAKLEGVLTGAGVEHDVKEYPRAGHSFLNRHNVGPAAPLLRVAGVNYDQPSAEDAWGRILRFFATHLVH